MTNDPHDSWEPAALFAWEFKRAVIEAVYGALPDLIFPDIFRNTISNEKIVIDPKPVTGGAFTIRPHQRAFIGAMSSGEAIVPVHHNKRRYAPILQDIQMIGRGLRPTTTIIDEAHHFIDKPVDRSKNKTPKPFQQNHPKRFKP